MSDLVKVIIDGKEIEVPREWTVMQACESTGAEIPRFCYHERLSVAGNCRMCLVEWVGAPKPQASCALGMVDLRPDRDGNPPKINTNSPLVKKAREGVMEFLLINHPLDCPICDQGGECDLQDQAIAFGSDRSRFEDNKRAVEDKYMGPLVKTIMTRCIHCTRCVRFTTEVAGVKDMGLLGRGEDAEITTYLEKALGSELSGNVIDLCPVGALTSKPYAFQARSWELRKTESVDVMDAVGTAIRIDARGREVMRIMPRIHEDVNEEWLADKSRFIWDGLKAQRLDQPYVRTNGKLMPASWEDALKAVANAFPEAHPERAAAITGDLPCSESQFALKQLMSSLGVTSLDCREDGTKLTGGNRAGYLFNSTIAGIDEADALLIIGANPRLEAPIINARIRKRYLARGFKGIALIGPANDLTYEYDHLGDDAGILNDFANHPFAEVLKSADKPIILIGQGALTRGDGAAILAACAKLAKSNDHWNGLNVLHTSPGRVAGLDLGFLPGTGGRDVAGIKEGVEKGEISFLYLLNADELSLTKPEGAFVVYQGHHGDNGAHLADVILPGSAYTEKDALWVNTEGRVQRGRRAIFPPGEAKDDWAILRALSAAMGKQLPFDRHDDLRRALIEAHPHFGSLNQAPGAASGGLQGVGQAGTIMATPISLTITDYYLTNPIARASKTMAECSRVFNGAMQAAAE
ncbi:NADH-quinone oxidoreductase subunit G [bacterium AH-315-P15]|nr:NADH-quinone oxidoreductase subunit G [bacterium AH-315-P15]